MFGEEMALANNPKNTIVIVTFGGGNIIVWACLAGYGTGSIYRKKCTKIFLEMPLLQYFVSVFLPQEIMWLENNAYCITTHSTL